MEDEDIIAVRRLALSLKPRFEAMDMDFDDMWDWICVLADYVIESTMDFADQDELSDENDLEVQVFDPEVYTFPTRKGS